jgi:exo-1,4-beta-D-glucosaminidase
MTPQAKTMPFVRALVPMLLFACVAGAAFAANAPVAVAGGAGSVVPIGGWEIQSSALAQQAAIDPAKTGAIISGPNFVTTGWHPAGTGGTVMASLVGDGTYRDVFYGRRLQEISSPYARQKFQIPWWYRAAFEIPQGQTELHTFLDIKGVIASADVWLNGRQIANHGELAGAYAAHAIDVTAVVHPGTNVLAVRVYPGDVQRDFIQSTIDWNPPSPDNNMGLWRGIDIVRSGPVSLHDLHVLTRVSVPKLASADVTVKLQARNDSDSAQVVVVSGELAGVALERRLRIGPHATVPVTFDPTTDPALRLARPRIWWPAGLGPHPLYPLEMVARIDGAVSDRRQTTFGIRDVRSRLTPQGHRQFVVNGVPLLIRGGGWATDMFLRPQPARLVTLFRYVGNLGLNAIRLEGRAATQEFYDLADRNGILVLPGWECCDKWEAWAKTGGEPWSGADLRIARDSMDSEARRLRDHPAVIGFLIGSDNAPPPEVARMYVDTLRAADWPDPIISAASDQATEAAGPSGMKMSGPYAWVPPDYWYADKLGGAFGFNSETSAGPDIPLLSSLRRMMAPDALAALWKDPDARQFHAAPFWSPFSRLTRFDEALAKRYGPPTSLEDYVNKAQLDNYANVRAQFEAYNAHMSARSPSTGVIYWMLNSAWPSLHWHLINHDLNPAGAYFGAKRANEPVHIQYSYDSRAVMAINHTLVPLADLSARVRVYGLAGGAVYDRELHGVKLAANSATRLGAVPSPKDIRGAYFVELELSNGKKAVISRNVYWLSSEPDQLDWGKSNFYVTPVSRYADLTALNQLPASEVKVTTRTRPSGDEATTTVTVTVPRDAKALAFFLHFSVTNAQGDPVVPALWSGNDVSLWPGESLTLAVRHPAGRQGATNLRLHGWNVGGQSLPLTVAQPPRPGPGGQP